MGSVRRLARLLTRLDVARPRAQSPGVDPIRDADGDLFPFRRMPLIVQKGGVDRGRLARVDCLGLVLRTKRPADDWAGVHGTSPLDI